jgi:hypothetical protein
MVERGGAARVAPVQVGEVQLLIETVQVAGTEPTSRVGDAGRQVVDAFGRVREAIVEVGGQLVDTMDQLGARAARPDYAEVQFGLKVSAQGNVIVASAAGEATLVVKIGYGAKPGD